MAAKTRSEPEAQVEAGAYDVLGFCKDYHISRPLLYLLWKRGEGPDSFKAGKRRLISREAATRWRRELEAVAAKFSR